LGLLDLPQVVLQMRAIPQRGLDGGYRGNVDAVDRNGESNRFERIGVAGDRADANARQPERLRERATDHDVWKLRKLRNEGLPAEFEVGLVEKHDRASGQRP